MSYQEKSKWLVLGSSIFLAWFSACGGSSSRDNDRSTGRGDSTAVTLKGRMSIVSGDNQVLQVHQVLPERLVVRISDPETENPIPDEIIQFSVVEGVATLSSPAQTTDVGGKASVEVTLGSVPSTVRIKAQWLPDPDSDPSRSVIFQAKALSAPPASINLVQGGGQCTAERAPFSVPIIMEIRNAYGDLLQGEAVRVRHSVGFGGVTEAVSGVQGKITLLGDAPELDVDLREAEDTIKVSSEADSSVKAIVTILISNDIFLSWLSRSASEHRVLVEGPCGRRLAEVRIVFEICCFDDYMQEVNCWYSTTAVSNGAGIAIANLSAGLPNGNSCWWEATAPGSNRIRF